MPVNIKELGGDVSPDDDDQTTPSKRKSTNELTREAYWAVKEGIERRKNRRKNREMYWKILVNVIQIQNLFYVCFIFIVDECMYTTVIIKTKIWFGQN